MSYSEQSNTAAQSSPNGVYFLPTASEGKFRAICELCEWQDTDTRRILTAQGWQIDGSSAFCPFHGNMV